MRLFLLSLLLALLSHQAVAQCTTQTAGLYNITLCPLASLTPPPQTNPTAISYSAAYAGTALRITIPFSFHLFGSLFNRVYVTSSGVLQFGATGTFSSTTYGLPLPLSLSDATPLIAPLWNLLYLNATTSSITYSTEGIAPNRSFVVRYNHMIYYGSSLTGRDEFATFDAILYEGTTAGFQFSYYNLTQPNTTNPGVYGITIGAEYNDNGQTYSLLQYNNVTASASTNFTAFIGLSGMSARWTFTGKDDSAASCSGAGYDLSSYANAADLSYSDSLGNTYWVHPCGALQTAPCVYSTSAGASACAVAPSGLSTLLARYQPSQAIYNALPSPLNGVQAVWQNGAYCSTIGAESVTAFNYVCDQTATTPVLSTVIITGTCLYTFTIRSSIVCTTNSSNAPTTTNYTSTLPNCTTSVGSNYTATWCPRNLTTPFVQTNPQTVPVVSTNTAIKIATVPIGFPFYLYETPFQTVSVGSHGSLSFGSAPSTLALGSFPIPIATSVGVDDYPLISALGSNLINSAPGAPLLRANITYSLEGNAPNRRFVVRYANLPIAGAPIGVVLASPQVSFDVVLYEGEPSNIDILYYSMPALPAYAASQGVVIGVHGDADLQTTYTTFSALNKQALTPTLASQLQSSTVSFRYTGLLGAAACGAYGANFTSLSNTDFNWTDPSTASDGTFFLRPCGITNITNCTSTPATAAASACQVSAGTSSGILLSIYNPTAVTWSPSPFGPGVRSTSYDGAYCAAATPAGARITIVDYICVLNDPRTMLINVTESPTCTYTYLMQTPLACSSSTACVVQNGDVYSSKLCGNPPPVLTQTAPTSLFAAGSAVNSTQAISLPFLFHVFGVPYDRMFVTTNGILQFGTTAFGNITSLPVGGLLGDSLPAIAAFGTSLTVANSGSVSYSLETLSSGQRAFVIRFSNVDFVGASTVGSELAVSFDVLLYEGVSGQTDVRLYRVDANPSATITIGLQAESVLSSNFLPYQNVPLTSTLATSLQNKVLTLSYTAQDESTATCGGLGYTFTLPSSDLTYFDSTSGNYYYMRPCGLVTSASCTVSASGERTSLCQISSSLAVKSLMVWAPSQVVYSYLPNGLQSVLQNGQYCASVSGPAITIINYVCNSTAPVNSTAITITSIVQSPACVFTVTMSTAQACGAGNRNNASSYTTSTLASCRSTSGTGYTASWCPRDLTTPYGVTPQTLTNLVLPSALVGADDATVTIPIGFNFSLYQASYSQLSINTNGLLTFGAATTSASLATTGGAFPSLGLPTTDVLPVIAPFFTDLVNAPLSRALYNYTGFIGYSLEGVAPSRVLIVRYSNVNYALASTVSTVLPLSVSFDVLLSESTSDIAIRYYGVSLSSGGVGVSIGIHGPGTEYTALQNAATINSALASQLAFSNVTLQWTLPLETSVCGGSTLGYTLAGLTLDASLNDGQSLWTVHPCGPTLSSPCARNASIRTASVCQSNANGMNPISLAIDNPSSTVWSQPNNYTLRSVIQDGSFCPATNSQRIVTVDYFCTPSAATPVLTAAGSIANSPCTYYFSVNTSQACYNAYPTYNIIPGPLYTLVKTIIPAARLNPPTQTAPTAILNIAGSNDVAFATVSIPFPVSMYNTSYTSVSISVNGNLQFGPSPVTSDYGTVPSTTAGTMPLLAMFWSDLINVSPPGLVAYSTEGVAPHRIFLIRFNHVQFWQDEINARDKAVSFDVYLYEDSTTIDVVYYRVDLSVSTTGYAVGVALSSSVFTNVFSDSNLPIASAVPQLPGFQFSWVYTGCATGCTVTIPIILPTASSSSSSTGAASSSSARFSSSASSSVSPSSSSTAALSSSPSSSSVVPSSTSAPVSSSSSSATPSSTSSLVASSSARSSSSSSIVASSTAVSSSTAASSSSSSPSSSVPSSSSSSTHSSSSSSVSPSSSSSVVSSSSSHIISSSSSSASASSSTGYTPITIPDNSAFITFQASFNAPVSNANFAAIEASFKLDVAANLASYGASVSALQPYLSVSINGFAAQRRLLQNSYPVTVAIFGTVNAVVATTDATTLPTNMANTLSQKIASGAFTATNSNANVPSQTPQVTSASSKSSSSSLGSGAIAGAVVGSVIGFCVLICVCLTLFQLSMRGKQKSSTDSTNKHYALDETSQVGNTSHVNREGHGEMEMTDVA